MRSELLHRFACVCVALLTCCTVACATGRAHTERPPADLSPTSLYPLREGAAWSYDVDAGDGELVLATTRVLRVTGTQVEVVSGQAVLRYALLPDGIQRVDGGTYLIRAPVVLNKQWTGTMGSQARVTALNQDLQTPAGKFESCVVVAEEGGDSGRKVTTTYCPGVGPVVVVSEMEVRGKLLQVTAKLRGYSLEAL